ncbi:DNA/RNA helicase domain-containing protein [Eggerthellaceae bacterium 3-80]|nr:DUF2075 domain-containing protein [bacterium D16-34]
MITIPTSNSAETPKGSPFYVDRCPFRFGEQIDYGVLELEEDKVFNWPMVYILANKDFAYVGQTTSLATRMSQHGSNEEKRDFDTVNVIFNEEFNTSVITDYEHRLIGYMHADGRYELTNKNDGMTDTNYFSKDTYATMFEELWEELRRLELADHTIAEIEESEVFKYSPFKGLTPDQRVALDKILGAIDDGLEKAEPIIVEGMPGTGKTILAIYLLKALRDDPRYKDMNIRIIEPVTSLRNTLRSSLASVSGLSPTDIIAPTDLIKPAMGYRKGEKKCFDIVLIDESHKLKRRVNLGTQFANYDKVNKELDLPRDATQIEWVLDQVKLPIFFYDPLQSIGPSCLDQNTVKETLGHAAENPIRLDSQMRVKGGKAYLEYIQNILDGSQEECHDFEDYDFILHDDFSDFVACFERDYKEHNLSRMIAGYAWKWASKDDSDAQDIIIDGIGLKWNYTYDNWVGRGANDSRIAHEVGCIHSIQGYDLSYAYVLIGNDLLLDENGVPASNKSSYFDRNGYATASKEELDSYIKNIYYVLLTRGILGTHVYVLDPKLREYFSRFFY